MRSRRRARNRASGHQDCEEAISGRRLARRRFGVGPLRELARKPLASSQPTYRIEVVSRMMSDDLQAMYRYLDTLTAGPNLSRLLEELSRFEINLDDLSEYMHFAGNGYKRTSSYSPNYQAWMLCWKNGQRSPIHNHSGSACVVRVLRGTLTETLFEIAPNGHVKASFSRNFAKGSLIGSEDTDIHQVSNLQAEDADLVTLHV